MESENETASAVNEEPAVELIEENIKLVVEIGTPEEQKSPQALPRKIVPDETELEPILEMSADARAQFAENYRSVAAGPISAGLKAGTVAGVCALVHGLITHQTILHLPLTIGLFAVAIVFRFLYVHWRASSLAKTKCVLTNERLTVSGPKKNRNWAIRISDIDRATLISEAGSRKSLVLSSFRKTHVLRGLTDPEHLWRSLPKDVQADSTALAETLQRFADSVLECKDADDVAQIRNVEKLQSNVQELLRQKFPDARVLKQDFSQITSLAIVTVVFLGIIFLAAHLGFPQYSLPILPLMLFPAIPEFLSLQRTLDCLYVFSADAVFEYDRKRGIVNTISLDRISIHNEFSENEKDFLYLDNQIHIPARVEKADSEYVKRCLQKYESSGKGISTLIKVDAQNLLDRD